MLLCHSCLINFISFLSFHLLTFLILPSVIYKKIKVTIILEPDLVRIQSLLLPYTNVLIIIKMMIIIHLISMVKICPNDPVIQLFKVLLLFKMCIFIITLILILLVNVLNSMTMEFVFQVIMNETEADNRLNRFLEVLPTKRELTYSTKNIQLGITNSSRHYVVSLTPLPFLILINRLLPFIIKHVMR